MLLLVVVAALLASAVPPLVAAQGFFSNLFGGHAHTGEQEVPPLGDNKWWTDRVEAATCTDYLCPRTLSCVQRPEHCPCPFPQQVACAYPDHEPSDDAGAATSSSTTTKNRAGGVVCVTDSACTQVQRLLKLGSTFKLKDLK